MVGIKDRIIDFQKDFIKYIKTIPSLSDDEQISELIKQVEGQKNDNNLFNNTFIDECLDSFYADYYEKKHNEYVLCDENFNNTWKRLSIEERIKVIDKLKLSDYKDLVKKLEDRIVVFEDIPELPDSAVRKLLNKIFGKNYNFETDPISEELHILTCSLKDIEENETIAVRNKLRGLLSAKEGYGLVEEIDFYGPATKNEILDARIKICNMIKDILLEELP